MDVFLQLIPVIDDLAPLSLCVGGLVNYSLILRSVYFIRDLNGFSMSNRVTCMCMLTHVAELYIQKHMQESSQRVSVSIGFGMKLLVFISMVMMVVFCP